MGYCHADWPTFFPSMYVVTFGKLKVAARCVHFRSGIRCMPQLPSSHRSPTFPARWPRRPRRNDRLSSLTKNMNPPGFQPPVKTFGYFPFRPFQ